MEKQSLKRLALAAIVGAVAWVLSAPAFAALLQAGGCSLTHATEEDYGQFLQCVRNSSLSQECKEYHRLATGIYCANGIGVAFCAGIFMGPQPGPPPESIQQLHSNLSLQFEAAALCTIDRYEWKGASAERVKEFLRSFAACIQPTVEQFKSQHGC